MFPSFRPERMNIVLEFRTEKKGSPELREREGCSGDPTHFGELSDFRFSKLNRCPKEDLQDFSV